MQKITPYLWFDGNLEEAVSFYTAVFPNAHVERMNPMTASFVIEGREFMALNGGPKFKFNEAVSFFIRHRLRLTIFGSILLPAAA